VMVEGEPGRPGAPGAPAPPVGAATPLLIGIVWVRVQGQLVMVNVVAEETV